MRKLTSVVVLISLLFLSGQGSAAVVIVNGLTHAHTLGETEGKIQGVITVRNEAAKESRIMVYRQDLISNCQSASAYPDAGSHQRSLGNHLSTNVDEKLLAGHEEYDVRYAIELDKSKIAGGTYWEVIMVEVGDPIKDELKNGIQVNSKVRYAIQIIVDVGNFEGPKLSFENIAFERVSPEQSVLKAQIKNNSSFGARTNVVLEVYDGQGNKLKTTPINSRMLYPGYCSTFEIALEGLAHGKYDCVIVADTGKDLFGSNVTIQVE